MKRQYTHQELEAQLHSTSNAVERRVQALGDELATSGEAAQEAFEDTVWKKPLAVVGAALAAGVLGGVLFGGRKRPKGLSEAHQQLVNRYIDTLTDEVRYAMLSGRDADEAMREAMEDRVPLIVYGDGKALKKTSSAGYLRQFVDLLFKTTMGFGIKIGLDALTARLKLDELIETGTAPGDDEDVAAVSAAVSESS